MLRIGVDFDNTLIRYDEVFRDLAARKGWIPKRSAASKSEIKRILLKEDGNDQRWQALQALAYGPEIGKARPSPGFAEFLRAAALRGDEVFIVSHKSARSHYDPSVELRKNALRWLKRRRLVANGHPDPRLIAADRVHFAGTRDEKVRKIESLGLDLFVDDLPEVLDHPRFPKKTRKVLFEGSWAEASRLADCLAAIGADAHEAIQKNLGSAPIAARPAGRGGNNRVLAVTLEDGRRVLLKRYLVDARDGRDRAGAEFAALSLMWKNGMRAAARPLYKDPSGAFALHALLPGQPLRRKPTSSDVDQAVAFLKKLQALRSKAGTIKPAADGRACLADYPRHLRRRLSRIEAGLNVAPTTAQVFVRKKIAPALERLIERFEEQAGTRLHDRFPKSQLILSPSDFGFHNAVQGPDGGLRFVDFEYFGWDDPAKLAADAAHHAGQRLSPAVKARLREGLSKIVPDVDSFRERLSLIEPLVAFEWILIVLNVLAPESLSRRRFSDPKRSAAALIRERVLKAKAMLEKLQ